MAGTEATYGNLMKMCLDNANEACARQEMINLMTGWFFNTDDGYGMLEWFL